MEIESEKEEKESVQTVAKATFLQGFFLGQFVGWNTALQYGYPTFLVSFIFASAAYYCFALCLAEMVSVFPFSGGSYGLVRVAISPYFGFLVAMSESLDYITFTSFGVSALGKMISYLMTGHEETPYNPLIWLVIYGMFLVSGIKGGNYSLWNFISIMTIGAILIKILYCFAAIPNYDYEENNDKSTVFASAAFVQALPYCASFFAGIEISTQLSCYVETPKEQIPKIILLATTLQCVLVIFTVLCIAAQAPGTDLINAEHYPFNPGFASAFNITPRAATAFALPGTFLTAFGFLFSFGRVVHSAAESKLLPHFLTYSLADGKKPYTALITGCVIAFMLEFVFLYISPYYRDTYIAFLAACRCIIFVSLLVSFIYFRRSFGHLPRGFSSPLGIYGAVYGIIIFGFGVIAVVVIVAQSSPDLWGALPVLGGYLLVTGVPYFAYVRYNQYYSKEEQSILFSVYVVQANHARAVHKTRKKTPLYNNNSTGGILISYVGSVFGTNTHNTDRAGVAHSPHRVAPSRENSISISHKAQNNSFVSRSKRSAVVAVTADTHTDCNTDCNTDVNTDSHVDVESASAGGGIGGGDNSGCGADGSVGAPQTLLPAQATEPSSPVTPLTPSLLHPVNSTDTCATSMSVSGKLHTIKEQEHQGVEQSTSIEQGSRKIGKVVSFQVEEGAA